MTDRIAICSRPSAAMPACIATNSAVVSTIASSAPNWLRRAGNSMPRKNSSSASGTRNSRLRPSTMIEDSSHSAM